MPPAPPSGKRAALGVSNEPSAFGAYVARPSESRTTHASASVLVRLSVQLAETCRLVDPTRGGGKQSSPMRRVLTKPENSSATKSARARASPACPARGLPPGPRALSRLGRPCLAGTALRLPPSFLQAIRQ